MFFSLKKTCHRENISMKNHSLIVLSITLVFIFSVPLLYVKDLNTTATTEYDAYLGLHHAGLTVSNIDRSVEFYRDVVGLKLLVPPTPVLSGPKVDEMTGIPGVAMKLAMFEVNKNHRLALKKPLIILKGGLTPSGSRVAASHTGSLAGSEMG